MTSNDLHYDLPNDCMISCIIMHDYKLNDLHAVLHNDLHNDQHNDLHNDLYNDHHNDLHNDRHNALHNDCFQYCTAWYRREIALPNLVVTE